MSLRPLLDIAAEDERFGALARRRAGDERRRAHVGRHPALPLAALVSSDDGLGGRPALIVAPDDIAARDLARDLAAYLAPQRVRYYPSRGTGYASHLAPPPHLVGLRIAALDSLSEGSAVVVASAAALAEAVPDASLRPAGLTLRKGEEVDLGEVGDRLVEAGYERTDQVEERGQFAIRGDILDVFGATEDRAARLELFGDEIEQIRWFSTFTQRSLGDAEAIELAPAAELGVRVPRARRALSPERLSAGGGRIRGSRTDADSERIGGGAAPARQLPCAAGPDTPTTPRSWSPRRARWSPRSATSGRTRPPPCTRVTRGASTWTSRTR